MAQHRPSWTSALWGHTFLKVASRLDVKYPVMVLGEGFELSWDQEAQWLQVSGPDGHRQPPLPCSGGNCRIAISRTLGGVPVIVMNVYARRASLGDPDLHIGEVYVPCPGMAPRPALLTPAAGSLSRDTCHTVAAWEGYAPLRR